MKNTSFISNHLIIYAIFLLIIISLFFFLGFDKVFFLGPQGIHFMRQTDSLSFASQYFNNGYHFFNPQLYNLKNIGGNAACEFPITYYLTALLYSIFDKKVFILKLLHLIIVTIGVIFIFRLTLIYFRIIFYTIDFTYLLRPICLFYF